MNKIIAARNRVREIEVNLRIAKDELNRLLETCPHEWKDPPTGYEHEGKYCGICGISELTIKR